LLSVNCGCWVFCVCRHAEVHVPCCFRMDPLTPTQVIADRTQSMQTDAQAKARCIATKDNFMPFGILKCTE